ncbi:MAG: hypothetical protein CMG46_02220 [Candidatus Marinimicrobia bacterium]|nr:hypothetical protein [Candidatus Neomarinimicrobiota bacterium]|tara:strand:+ start:171 stop:416 length:246 start_codon:yes stop_codon:yes gene_type:complete
MYSYYELQKKIVDNCENLIEKIADETVTDENAIFKKNRLLQKDIDIHKESIERLNKENYRLNEELKALRIKFENLLKGKKT